MEWTDPLKSQQIQFIERLQAGAENLLRCKLSGIHGEIKVISSSNLKQLREYCWEMAEKYKKEHPRQVFINHMKGKLGEEVVKECLANLVDKVNYQILPSGDGKVDLFLNSKANIGIQVKTRCSDIDKVYWSITPDELQKNKVIACVLIPEKQKDFDEFRSEYYPIMGGFLPTEIIRKQISENSLGWEENNENKSVELKIYDLLYSGGLRSYLEKLNSQTLDEINLVHLKSEKWEFVDCLSFIPASRIRCIDLHPKENILASGGDDYEIKIWDLKTKSCLFNHKRYYYNNDLGDIKELKFSSDGKFIITTGHVSGSKSIKPEEQKKIQVLDWETGIIICSLPSLTRFEYSFSVAVCPNTNILAYDVKNKIQLYDFHAKQFLNILEGHNQSVKTITFSPDSKILASGSGDGEIKTWNWETGKSSDLNFQHLKAVNKVVISPNSKILASGSDDGTIALFRFTDRKVYLEFNAHSDSVNTISFSPDSLILASGGKDNSIKLWHVKTGELIETIQAAAITEKDWEKEIFSIIFSPDSQLLLASVGVGQIKIWQRF